MKAGLALAEGAPGFFMNSANRHTVGDIITRNRNHAASLSTAMLAIHIA